MISNEITQDEVIDYDQPLLDHNSITQAKYRLYKILSQRPGDQEARQLLRQILHKYSSAFLQDKQKFMMVFERQYQVIHRKTISLAAMGWRYCLGLDRQFINPSLPAVLPSKSGENHPEVIVPKAPCTASEYLEQILNISDIPARWHYVNELVCTENEQLLADDFIDTNDLELLDSLKKTLCGGKLNILILGAGCVGLALANTLKTSLGELVKVLMIENRIQSQHIKKPYTRNWLTNLPNNLYEDFFEPRVVQILREFGNGHYMGVPLNMLETLLFLSNRAQGTQFYFTDNYKLSLIRETDTDMVIDATGGKLNIIGRHELNDSSFLVNLSSCREFGRRYEGFAITNFDDIPALRLRFDQKGSFFYPSFEGQQLKSAMFKLIDVPLELYESLLVPVEANNSDSLIYIWPGKLRTELNSLLILINLSLFDYQQLRRFLTQKTDLNSFMTKYAKDLQLDQRILEFLRQIQKQDTQNNSKIEPPFLYEPYIHLCDEKPLRLFGRPVFRIGDSVFNGHPKVGNGLGSHLSIVGKLHDAILALS